MNQNVDINTLKKQLGEKKGKKKRKFKRIFENIPILSHEIFKMNQY
jgi:hypothetical protein